MLSNQRFFRFYAENILHVCPPVEHIFMSLRIGFPDSRQGRGADRAGPTLPARRHGADRFGGARRIGRRACGRMADA